MIGASIKIKGDIAGDENLVIDGEVEGQVNLDGHDLTIGSSGVVTANLSAKTVHIHGTVNGDIEGSELVVVSKTGRVLGNIVAPRVTLEDGAQFKGSIDMTPKSGSFPGNEASKGPMAAGSVDGEAKAASAEAAA